MLVNMMRWTGNFEKNLIEYLFAEIESYNEKQLIRN